MHISAATLGCTGSDPTNFWDSNMGPPKFCSKVLIHYTMDPSIFSTPAAPLVVHCRRGCIDGIQPSPAQPYEDRTHPTGFTASSCEQLGSVRIDEAEIPLSPLVRDLGVYST